MATSQKQVSHQQSHSEEEVWKLIKACLISVKGEIPMDQLKRDFKKLGGYDIPFKELKHATLASLLQSAPEKVVLHNRKGQLFVNTANAGDAKHIQRLVNQQKSISKKPKKSKNKNYQVRQPNYSNTWTPPQNRFSRGNPAQIPQQRGLTLNNQMAARLSFPRESRSNFYTNGRWHIPRATYDTDKQYAPYFQVPPRFNNNMEAKLGEGKPGGKTYKKLLEEAVKTAGIEDTIFFNTIPLDKKGHSWVCSIKFGEYKFICYPEAFPKPIMAEEVTAKKALDGLKKAMEEKTPTRPTTPQSDFDVSVDRVKELVSKETTGVLWDYLRDEYARKYQETLSPDWPQQVIEKAVRGIVIEKLFDGRYTIRIPPPLPLAYCVQPVMTQIPPTNVPPPTMGGPPIPPICGGHSFSHSPTSTQPMLTPPPPLIPPSYASPPSSPRTCPESLLNMGSLTLGPNSQVLINNKVPPPLKLPESQYFNVYTTVVKDCTEFCLRLLGDGYSVDYENLTTDMELYYMEDSNKVSSKDIICGGYYACSLEESWFRVQVTSILDNNKVTVFFVDHGDEEEIATSNLFVLPPQKFLQLPFQHVRCSLAGLEFCKDTTVTSHLQQLSMGKPLVAQVLSRDEDSLSVILFDTSTEEDVNINKKLLELVPDSFLQPSFPSAGGVVEVYYSYVTDEGDLYVTIESETYNTLMMMLDTAKSLLGPEEVSIDLTKLYLAKFSQDGQWHRAAPRGPVKNDQVEMFFVDWGNTELVTTNNIRSVDKHVTLLSKIPSQALKCHLHTVPPSPTQQWTTKTSKRLISLITVDQPLLLKVVTEGTEDKAPLVELFKRLQPQNELVSINQTLAFDSTLFSGESGDSNNNKKDTTSISHTRSSSNASLASSLNSGPSSLTTSPLSSLVLPDTGELPPPMIPPIGEFFDVYVTYAANPFNFAIQGRLHLSKFHKLSNEMNNYYNDPKNVKTHQVSGNVREGGHYAVKHDQAWYRARIDRMISNVAAGLFVDYGDQFGMAITSECVCELASQFKHLPYQAIRARLTGVAPINKDWTPEDSLYFCHLTQNKEFVSVIKKIVPNPEDKILTVELSLVDTSDKTLDVFIDKVLINENRAIKV